MTGRLQSLRLADLVEAIELINNEMGGVTLQAFEPDKRKRWIVERGIEIISKACRHIAGLVQVREDFTLRNRFFAG
jgi:uncharacterized protein with HEPN domain